MFPRSHKCLDVRSIPIFFQIIQHAYIDSQQSKTVLRKGVFYNYVKYVLELFIICKYGDMLKNANKIAPCNEWHVFCYNNHLKLLRSDRERIWVTKTRLDYRFHYMQCTSPLILITMWLAVRRTHHSLTLNSHLNDSRLCYGVNFVLQHLHELWNYYNSVHFTYWDEPKCT